MGISHEYHSTHGRRRRSKAGTGLRLAGVIVAILLVAYAVTAILEKGTVEEDSTPQTGAGGIAQNILAPLPMQGEAASGSGSEGAADSSGTAQAVQLESFGPARQTDGAYTIKAYDASVIRQPACGQVDLSYFSDAAFLGDSLTVGFSDYQINLSGALICGYRSISPNTIVNRTTVTNPDRGEEVALDVLAANQPAKLYILLGTNALVQTGNEDSFINYYARMLDELRAALPNTTFYVQSILCATQETVEDDAPGLSPDHIGPINQQIKALCEERGLYYLDLNAEFSDENGYLLTDYAQPDGIHLTVSGYNKWVSYLCTHTPYSKNNPYQPGSTYYLSEEMQRQLADLP